MASQNPWWADIDAINRDSKVQNAMISLKINDLMRRLEEYKFIDRNRIIMGPRQVGKTTYIKMAIRDLLLFAKANPRNVFYFSCDSLSMKGELLELLRLFDSYSDKSQRRYIFLDEVTFIEDWNVAVLSLFNSDFLKDKCIYLTGSSSLTLRKETMPGRDIEKDYFYPMNFREYFKRFYGKDIRIQGCNIEDVENTCIQAGRLVPFLPDLNNALESYAFRSGGFLMSFYFGINPVGKQPSSNDPFDALYEVYKDGAITEIVKSGKSERTFREIMSAILTRYGSRISSNSIAKDTSIGSNKTVESYLGMMEQLFLIRVLHSKRNGRVIYRGSKKAYLIDPFLYRVMKLYSTGSKDISDAERSHIIEGIVGEHMIRRYKDIFFMFTSTGKEVDFLYNDIGVEVKYGNGNYRDLHTDKGYVLTRNAAPSFENGRALMPISMFLYLIS